jgi:hypothetical protein
VESWLEARRASSERIEQARADATAFFADFAGLATWPVLRQELRGFDVPMAVLLSPDAPAHVTEVGRALAALVPGAALGDADEVVAALRGFLSA